MPILIKGNLDKEIEQIQKQIHATGLRNVSKPDVVQWLVNNKMELMRKNKKWGGFFDKDDTKENIYGKISKF